MMPAAKHGDPQLGVDIHMCAVPPSPSPVPLPTPHMSIVFDPFDYVPIFGATVTVCGMKRATAGTNAMVVHIPPGFPIVPTPKPPEKDDELFMGSSTVVADGDPFSFIAVPVLSCQIAGMPSIPRLKKKGPKKLMLLPLTVNLAIPTNVVVGGPPTISLMGMAFKGIFAALGKFAKSGLFKRIRQRLFRNLNPGFLKCTILRAEPVNILTGTVSVEQEDFTLPGRITIKWVRSYSSGSQHSGLCGHGWETPADSRLEVDASNGSVSLIHPTVGPLFFNRLPIAEGEGSAELELMDGALLSDHGDEFRIRTKEDRIYHFAKALAQVNEGGVTEYPIIRITDLCGNWLEFERRGKRIIGINESAGRRIEIASENSRITEVALYLPDTQTRHVFVRYEYDMAGDLIYVIDALGNPYTFAYDAHHMVRHTDRNGLSFYYEYDKSPKGDRRVVHAWGDGDLYNYRFHYFDELNERRITDSLGHVSIVKLDEQGLPISEIDPLGGMTIYEYDEVGRTSAVVDPAGNRTQYQYDERGNLLKLIRPDDKTIQTEFNAANKAVVITDPNGAQWQQKWDGRGLLVEQTTPLGNVSHYEYDGRGQLVAFTNPRGARTELAFDPVGNLASLKDALGHRTLFTYDLLGNVTGKLDPLDRKTLYRYDAKSRLTDVRLPSGATIRCAYDAADNLTSYQDENGAVTRLDYCGLGEIKRRLQPDGHTVEYHYDTEERLTGVTNQRGETYQLRRDALGRIVEEIDYCGQSRTYGYSACGYIERSIDPLGRAIAYATDPLGRIIKKTLPDPDGADTPFEESFEYDANGNLVGCANPHIRVERSFDAEGHMVEEKHGADFVIRNTYNKVGNRIERQTELKHGEATIGHDVKYAYDALDQAIGIAIDDNPPIRIERDAAGQIVAEQLSPALHREIEYSADGHLTRQRVLSEAKAIVDVAYGYDAAGNLTERRDAQFGIDQYTYDPVGRITQHLDPQGKLKQYFNDPAGDRLRTRIVEGGMAEAGPGSGQATDREWSCEGEYEGAFYRFDRAGNLVERRDERGELTLRWDANQRLIESRMNGTSTRYQYDPLGRRIEKRTADKRTGFVWDGDALVGDALVEVGQTTPVSAGAVREWVYFPETFEPLAMISGVADRESVLYYHNDPNGCPTRLTDARGEVKWAASYTAWGEMAKLYASAVDNPIRLQGQYCDVETGFHYNTKRYYDPVLGAFVSQDPLRLEADENPCLFAPNVLGWIDPLGLACKKPRSTHPIGRRFRFSTLKEAREAAERASPVRRAVKHVDAPHGPHFHPADEAGKVLNHDHYYFPWRYV